MLQHPHVYPVSMQHTIYSTEQQMIIEPLTSGDVVMTAQQSSYCITQPELNDEHINQTTIQEIYDQAQFNLPRADPDHIGLRGSELYSELINQTTIQEMYAQPPLTLPTADPDHIGLRGSELYSELINQTTIQEMYAQPPLTLPTADPDHIGMYGSELYSESINQNTIQESYAQPPPLSTASHIPICLPAPNPPSPCLRMSAPTPIAITKAETTVGQPNIVTTASTYASSDTLVTPAIKKDPLVTPDPIVTASLTALTSVDVKNSVTKTNPTQVLKVPNASDKMSSIYPSLTSEASTPVISSGTVSDNQKPSKLYNN